MCTAVSVYQIAKELSDKEIAKLYEMISDDVTLTLEQSPKGRKKYSFPMSQIEIEIQRRLLTQVFHVDLDKDVKE
jgi:hypothetical protein